MKVLIRPARSDNEDTFPSVLTYLQIDDDEVQWLLNNVPWFARENPLGMGSVSYTVPSYEHYVKLEKEQERYRNLKKISQHIDVLLQS